jgi:hypothetical protein
VTCDGRSTTTTRTFGPSPRRPAAHLHLVRQLPRQVRLHDREHGAALALEVRAAPVHAVNQRHEAVARRRFDLRLREVRGRVAVDDGVLLAAVGELSEEALDHRRSLEDYDHGHVDV